MAEAGTSTVGIAPGAARWGDRTVLSIVGNPKVGSRTHGLAGSLAELAAARLGFAGAEMVDLSTDTDSDLGAELVRGAGLVVVASPTYKATYTGLLKTFFDGLPYRALNGKVAIGAMVAASDLHLFAADVHLRPLLTELGAICPVPALAVAEPELESSGVEGVVETWWAANGPVLERWFS